VKTSKQKNLLYAAVCVLLFVVSLYFSIPIWFLFLVLAIYFAYRRFIETGPTRSSKGSSFVPNAFGVIGTYDVDGDRNDPSYGMYIELQGHPVFIDIREDEHLEKRRARALALNESKTALESSLANFISSNPEYARRGLLGT
jgi:hypothetical protein